MNSKEKGKRFERQLAGMIRDYGYDAHRSAQYCGKNGGVADVVGLPGIHIEAKHQETMRLYDWIDQAKRDVRDADNGDVPVVMHKKNNAEVLVTMRFDDFMEMYNKSREE